MKAMVLEAPGPIERAPLQLRDWPCPEPGEGEIRLRVRYCAVCRTDLHIVEGELTPPRLPIIPGHMIVGEVDALGPGCHRYQQGDRAGVAWLRHTCGACLYCRSGRENLCEASAYTGLDAHGGYAEYCIAAEAYAYALPSACDDLDAAPLLCSGIIGYRALERARVPEGGTLALYGFGSSAHVILQIARHRGARVFVVTRSADHQAHARTLGAEWAGSKAAALPELADAAILFAPVGALVPEALGGLKRGGTLAVAGIYLSPVPEMDYDQHLFYERDLRTVTGNTRDDGRALLAEAAAVPVRPDVHTYPLEDANCALDDLKASRLNGTAVLAVGA